MERSLLNGEMEGIRATAWVFIAGIFLAQFNLGLQIVPVKSMPTKVCARLPHRWLFGLRFRSGIFGCLLALYVGSGQTWAAGYQLTEIGVLPGCASSSATSLNDAGQVVGHCVDPARPSDSANRAFVFHNGSMSEIQLPSGQMGSVANAINNQGVIVGAYTSPPNPSRACFLEPSFISLPMGGYTDSATGINESGIIAGTTGLGGANPSLTFARAVRTFKNGGFALLNTPIWWNNSEAWAINASNWVAMRVYLITWEGEEITGPQYFDHRQGRAFLLANGDLMDLGAQEDLIDLGTLGGDDSSARGLNDLGEVCGWSNRADGSYEAFIYRNSTLSGLGVPEDATDSFAFGINEKSEVVGFIKSASGNERAVLFKQGEITDLNTLVPLAGAGERGFTELNRAVAINESGQIVGTGTWDDGEGNTFTRGFLFSPIDDSAVAPPSITPDEGGIENAILISLSCPTDEATIRYTTNGKEPNKNAKKYNKPFRLRNSKTVKAKAFLSGKAPSPTTTKVFSVQ